MPQPESPAAGAARQRLPLFVAAIALSAFLLFAMELLFGALVLPVFGGAPAVWTTALCFFTAVVFVGYLYAHLVATRLSTRAGAFAHVALALVALALALVAPHDLAAVVPTGLAVVAQVMAVLALTAGPPALLLATTTPLLSHWFALEGWTPWWLYAVSNGASLAGLLAYPLLIEPLVPLSAQRIALEASLALLVLLLIALALGPLRRANSAARAEAGAEDAAPAGLSVDLSPVAEAPLTRARQWWWLAAACVPAGLMAATTTHITTDHASAPLIWIGPLGVYLASLAVAFSSHGRRATELAEKLVPAAATLMWIPWVVRVDWPVALLIPLLLTCLAVLSLAVHGRLALDRPPAEHLTRFYLLVSAGGVAATAFVALMAPAVFDDVYEFPLLVLASLVVLAAMPGAAANARARESVASLARRVVPYIVGAGLILVAFRSSEPNVATFVAVATAIGLLAVLVSRSPAWLAGVSAIAVLVLWLAFTPAPLVRVRTFFGVTQVRVVDRGSAHEEFHGTTLHGLQFLDARRTQPTAYFVRSGPLGDVFAQLDARRPEGASIGVTGLGGGTIAAYERAGDRMRFFEIDPAVVALARDPRYFRYLADAPSTPQIVLGDGRLSLARQPAGGLDVLVLDAFSSDTLPTHLLTAEAMRTYERALAPGAVMAFNITNRHYDLGPAIAATARSLGLDARERRYAPSSAEATRIGALPSDWIVVGRAADVSWFDTRGWARPGAGPVLTDDFSDVTRLIRWF